MTEEPTDDPAKQPTPLDPGETLILVRRAKDGDDDAFTELYKRHADRVARSVSLRLAGEGVHALEDVVQETFMYAFEGLKAGKFDENHSDGGFRNWIATIAVNKIRDRARLRNAQKRGGGREKLMRDAFSSTMGDPGFASPLARPSQILRGREFEGKLSEALEELGERHRRIIDLRDHCEMAFDEIAGEMGYKKAATMRSLYKRAKTRLREILQTKGIEAM
jgi:RNA polymerase sigma factor (sigma-70 family)